MANRVSLICSSLFESKAIASALTYQSYAVVLETADLNKAELMMTISKPNILIIELIDRIHLEFANRARGINSSLAIVFIAPIYDLRLFDLNFDELPSGSQVICKSNIANFDLLFEAIERSFAVSGESKWASPRLHEETDELTDLQVQTLRMVVSGYTNKEISRLRFVSEKSVEQIVARLAHVLGLSCNNGQNLRVLLTAKFMNWTNGRK